MLKHPTLEELFAQLEMTLHGEKKDSPFIPEGPLYIYGAGNIGRELCRILRQKGIRVAGFLDRKAQLDAVWEGIPILSPEAKALTSGDRAKAQVIVAIFNRDTEMPSIFRMLSGLGYGRVLSLLEAHSYLAQELGDRFWLTSRSFYLDKKEIAAKADALWSDEVSRKLFRNVLEFRFTRNYEALPPYEEDDQYFPADLPAWPAPVRFVDCGAYDGDTVRDLIKMKTPIGALAAFEPDPANFEKLVATVKAAEAEIAGEVALFPCGVDAVSRQIRFSTGQGTSSHASEDGESVIQCVALDDALPLFRPTVIKMDIEGAEVDALLGARRMIERHRPGLALSVYHRPEHLWSIPLLVQSWLKGGRHYLRAHGWNGFDLIYYWMP